MTNIELAYLAGVIDSDGNINIRKLRGRKACSHLSLRVSSKYKYFIKKLYKIVKVGTINSSKNRGINKIIMYQWRCSTREARELLIKLKPYLILKQEEAELALEIVKDMKVGANKLSDKELLRRRRLYEKIIKIRHSNSRGK